MRRLFIFVLLVSCGGLPAIEGHRGRQGDNGTNGSNGTSCTTKQTLNGAILSCSDGTSAIVLNGVNGKDGAQGIQGPTGATGPQGAIGPEGVKGLTGLNGGNCTVATTTNGASVVCPDGSTAIILNGIDGINGVNGTNGSNGTNGTNGINGKDGTNGTNGSNGTSVVPEKLCADSSAGFPEYGFKIGTAVYAVYYGYLNNSGNPSTPSNGQLESFMSKLTPGAYMSTNGTGCTFSIDSAGNIIN